MARVRGCDGSPAPSPVLKEEIGDVLNVFWHCPKKFIPKSVYKWYDIYSYHTRFISAPMPSYENVSAVFVRASNAYESFFSEFTQFLNKRKNGGK